MRLEAPSCFVALLVPVVVGCGSTDEEIDARITARLVQEKLVASPAPPPDPTKPLPPAAPPPDPVDASNAFLARLDELMADYAPVPPDVDGAADVLRCVTTKAIEDEPALREAGTALERARRSAQEARRRDAKVFAEVVGPRGYRLDYAWAERHDVHETFGCAYTDGHGWHSATTRSECCDYWSWGPNGRQRENVCPSAGVVWKVRSTQETPEFLYSGTTTAAPPELMRRAEAAHLDVLGRLSCRVVDVADEDGATQVTCKGVLRMRLTGTPAAVNAGDVISAPLRDVKREPGGVLAKDLERGTWVIDVDAATVTIDEHAVCPSVEEILTAAAP